MPISQHPKTLLLVLSTLFALAACSPHEDLTFPLGASADFDWKPLEHKVARSEVDRFINSTPNEFEIYRL